MRLTPPAPNRTRTWTHEIFNPPETYVDKRNWTETMAKIERMGGSNQDPEAIRADLPEWLGDSVIPVPKIETFKEELRQKGML